MILIDGRDKRPIYEQVVDKMSSLMLKGIIEADEKLPSVRSLAIDLSINPNTIQRAYMELEREGYIYSVKGKGSFVADLKNIKELKKKSLFKELELLIDKAKSIALDKQEFISYTENYYEGLRGGA